TQFSRQESLPGIFISYICTISERVSVRGYQCCSVRSASAPLPMSAVMINDVVDILIGYVRRIVPSQGGMKHSESVNRSRLTRGCSGGIRYELRPVWWHLFTLCQMKFHASSPYPSSYSCRYHFLDQNI